MLKDLSQKVCGIAGWDVTPVMVDGKPYEVPAEVLDHLHYKQPVFDGVRARPVRTTWAPRTVPVSSTTRPAMASTTTTSA